MNSALSKFFLSLIAILLSVPAAVAQDRLYANEFPLGDVTLLDGPLKKARDLKWTSFLFRRG